MLAQVFTETQEPLLQTKQTRARSFEKRRGRRKTCGVEERREELAEDGAWLDKKDKLTVKGEREENTLSERLQSSQPEALSS